jgi:MFS family permease
MAQSDSQIAPLIPPSPLAPREVERRNFLLNLIEGALFISSGGIVTVQTVIPALVVRLGGNDVAVGALIVVVYVGAFLPQVLAARVVETIPWKKPWSVKYGFYQRLALLLNVFVIWTLGASHPGLALALFLSLFAAQQVLGGIATPGWFDFFTKLTPVKKRGRLIGLRISLGGFGALLSGGLLTWLLFRYPFPMNYAIALLVASFLQFSSLFVQRKALELEPSRISERKPLFVFLRDLPEVLRRDPDFRRFLISSAFLVPATMPVGFFTVYVLRRFQTGEGIVGTLTLSMIAIQVVSALVTGYFADRHGNKIALIVAASAMLCASAAALLAPSAEWFILVYMFVGINAGSEIMTRYNMAVEYGPPEKRATYVGLMNTLLAPLYLSGLLGGVISETLGYGALFGLGFCCSVIGLWLLISKVREPRGFTTGSTTGPS